MFLTCVYTYTHTFVYIYIYIYMHMLMYIPTTHKRIYWYTHIFVIFMHNDACIHTRIQTDLAYGRSPAFNMSATLKRVLGLRALSGVHVWMLFGCLYRRCQAFYRAIDGIYRGSIAPDPTLKLNPKP